MKPLSLEVVFLKQIIAAQLLGYYRKGLELQNRLIEAYRERQEEDGR